MLGVVNIIQSFLHYNILHSNHPMKAYLTLLPTEIVFKSESHWFHGTPEDVDQN
jgi:hypothetical protein